MPVTTEKPRERLRRPFAVALLSAPLLLCGVLVATALLGFQYDVGAYRLTAFRAESHHPQGFSLYEDGWDRGYGRGFLRLGNLHWGFLRTLYPPTPGEVNESPGSR